MQHARAPKQARARTHTHTTSHTTAPWRDVLNGEQSLMSVMTTLLFKLTTSTRARRERARAHTHTHTTDFPDLADFFFATAAGQRGRGGGGGGEHG